MSQRIVVVCIGNICRSPTAELLFRHYAPGVIATSAGLAAMSGQPMEPTALAVARERGLDGSHHVARQLYASLMHEADLILAVEAAQVTEIAQETPEVTGRVFLLDQWGAGSDVADPYGLPRTAFEDAYVHIDAAVQAWLPHLGRD